MPSLRKLADEQEGQLGDAQIRQGLVLTSLRLLMSFWMRGSATGLSLLTGFFLGDGIVSFMPLMRLCIMILGSAEDPSSFTLFSPNMVVVTELLRSPWNPIFVGVDVDELRAAGFVPAEELIVFVADGGGGFSWTVGCGRLCIDPHNFLILGKLWRADPLVREGGGYVAAAPCLEKLVEFCGVFVAVVGVEVVLVAAGFESVAAGALRLFLEVFVVVVGELSVSEGDAAALLGVAAVVATSGFEAAGTPEAAEAS